MTAVAMSGGLDSSVVAWLLARRGEEHAAAGPVVGLSMLLWDHSDTPVHGRCCGALDLADARRVAQQVGIPHYTLRMDDDFRRKVVDPFVDDYLAGRTPSPCVACNTWIKFDLLLERARRFGARRLATGHYARLVDGPAGRELHAAAVADKDQSYFLFELTREQLEASLFPLGGLAKEETRELARQVGLAVAEKGESMEICFVADGVRPFVEREVRRRRGEEGGLRRALLPVLPVAAAEEAAAGQAGGVAVALQEPALIVDREGRELGRGSAPYYRYTVGQRRGLGVSSSALPGGGGRLYVLQIDAARNRVVVGDGDELACRGLSGGRTSWINPELDLGLGPSEAAERHQDAAAPVEATVRIRSRHPGVPALIRPLPDGRCEIDFAEPQRGVAPGQAAVFYQGSRVLGGCWIERGLR
jgi:tRNA-specific 2-thiouridylase